MYFDLLFIYAAILVTHNKGRTQFEVVQHHCCEKFGR